MSEVAFVRVQGFCPFTTAKSLPTPVLVDHHNNNLVSQYTVNNAEYSPEQKDDEKRYGTFTLSGRYSLDEHEVETE